MAKQLILRIKQHLARRRPNVLAEDGTKLTNCEIIAPVTVGFRTYANAGGFLRNVSIGRFCSIGRRVTIGAAKHPTELLSTHPVVIGAGIAPETRIGNDVWIGDNVVIIAGIQVGDGAVIGAGAVVTKDVEPYSIVAGVPAREIRKRFDASIREQLLASKWWDYGEAAVAGDPVDAIKKAANAELLPPHHKPTRF
jgi:virginiamycin A acetyltransferase